MLGTLIRAGAVLDLFTTEEPEWGVTATAQRLGIGKSLAHDVLASLAAIGLLQRVGHGRYRLGWRTMSLASVLMRTNELRARARPVVRDLAERQRLTVGLVAWDCGRVIYIDRRHDPRRLQTVGPLAGAVGPLDGSAASKVLLASRPDAEIRSLWAEGVIDTGHRSLDDLQRELERIRLHGWAADEPGHSVGGRAAVAAAIRGSDGDVAAAISLDVGDRGSGTGHHLHARVVQAAASRISEAIRHAEAAPQVPVTTPAQRIARRTPGANPAPPAA